MKRLENDKEFSNRLCNLLPRGAVYMAQDLGELRGKALDYYARYSSYFTKIDCERKEIEVKL